MADIQAFAETLLLDLDTVFFKTNTLTTTTIFLLVCNAMEKVNKYNTLSGLEKKAVVLCMMKKAVTVYINDTNEVLLINTFIDTFGSSMIDQLVDVGRNGLKVNKESGCYKFFCGPKN